MLRIKQETITTVLLRKLQRLVRGQIQVIDDSRRDQLFEVLPEINEVRGQRILYVGACKDRHDFLPDFLARGAKVTLVEVYEPYLKDVKELFKPTLAEAHLSDILGWMKKEQPNKVFDGIFWWHGPEHVPTVYFEECLELMEKACKGWICLGFPWGKSPQDHIDGNKWQRHQSTLYTDIPKKYGFEVSTVGKPDQLGSSITAIKHM
ncbi:MAG TPA: hypothetical protein ENH10_08195 [Bacteroidetes bacterium]|nr:hypothetical protein BMS3Bbin04_00640 [bacterium BMS3Bbin04]HDO65993.1 hypothetical protein [Bacteroidota bacterium]HEX05118.1 hypothetical protein [Bacteroidota bacterium]